MKLFSTLCSEDDDNRWPQSLHALTHITTKHNSTLQNGVRIELSQSGDFFSVGWRWRSGWKSSSSIASSVLWVGDTDLACHRLMAGTDSQKPAWDHDDGFDCGASECAALFRTFMSRNTCVKTLRWCVCMDVRTCVNVLFLWTRALFGFWIALCGKRGSWFLCVAGAKFFRRLAGEIEMRIDREYKIRSCQNELVFIFRMCSHFLEGNFEHVLLITHQDVGWKMEIVWIMFVTEACSLDTRSIYDLECLGLLFLFYPTISTIGFSNDH